MSSRVFVGGLSYRVAEHDIHKFFQKYGRVKEVSMKSGFAFVEFDDHRDADDAVYELNGKHLMGERVTVERAKGTPRGTDSWRGSSRSWAPPPPRRRSRSRGRDRDYDRDIRGGNSDRYGPPTRTDHRLIVENLSSRVSWQDLKDYMRQAGEVTYADAHKDRKNEGVVEFASSSDMRNAVSKLDDTELNGRRIRLVEDRRSSRRRSRSSSSRSRSRSRRRSRSRSSRSSRSKSHARSKSPSRSKSRGHSKSKSKSRSRSRSKSEIKKSRSKSRSQSVSKGKPTKQASRSPSKEKSKSRSRSPQKNGDCSDNNDD